MKTLVLVACLLLKHRILVETYGDHALSETTCRDWFRRFKNNDFDVEDKERSGAPKKFEDEELEALLDEDPCQTQKELAESLGVDHTTVAKAVVYASNPEVLKTFQDNIGKCAQELNKSPDGIDVTYCVLQKHSWIDEKDQYLPEKGLAAIDDLITDEVKGNEAKEIMRKCYGRYASGYGGPETNKEITMKGIQCAMPAMAMIGKY